MNKVLEVVINLQKLKQQKKSDFGQSVGSLNEKINGSELKAAITSRLVEKSNNYSTVSVKSKIQEVGNFVKNSASTVKTKSIFLM